MGEIRFVENFGRVFRFSSLKTPHAITTNDFGSIKSKVLMEANQLESFFEEFFSCKTVAIAKPNHEKNFAWLGRAEEKKRIFEVDSMMKSRHKESEREIIAFNTGDCPLVFFENKNSEKETAGIIHSGWKGTALNITSSIIKSLILTTNDASKIRIGLWTGICRDCYEVDLDVWEVLGQYSGNFRSYGRKKFKLDLAGIIVQQLVEAGINEKQIETSDICPCCHKENDEHLFYSNRRGDSERNGAFILA